MKSPFPRALYIRLLPFNFDNNKNKIYGGHFQICGYDSTFMVVEYKGGYLDCIQNQQTINVDVEHL